MKEIKTEVFMCETCYCKFKVDIEDIITDQPDDIAICPHDGETAYHIDACSDNDKLDAWNYEEV